MPEAGETLICRLDKGGKIIVTLDDRVYPDASINQYEAGWWVYTTLKHPNYTNDYFLSEAGILYACDDNVQAGFTRAVGIHVPWARIVKQADAELEQFVRDDLINRSFDAYR